MGTLDFQRDLVLAVRLVQCEESGGPAVRADLCGMPRLLNVSMQGQAFRLPASGVQRR